MKQNLNKTSERPYQLEEMVFIRYNFAAKFVKGKKVVDVGTGVGIGANYLAELGAKKVIGVDYSRDAISYAKKKLCIISTPNKLVTSLGSKKPLNPYHTKEFTPAEFTKICKTVFKNVSLYGIHCKNTLYLHKTDNLKKNKWYRFIVHVGKSRLVRELLPLIPSPIKQKITGEGILPKLTADDFSISKKNMRKSIGMIAVCRNPKKI